MSSKPWKVKGFLKGLKYISTIFGDEEKEAEFKIGNPTDVKHVAHIGGDGPAVETPSWMKEFTSTSSGFSAPLSAPSDSDDNSVKWVSEDSKRSPVKGDPKVPKSSRRSSDRNSGDSNDSTKKGRSRQSRRSQASKDSSDKLSQESGPNIPRKSRQKKSKESNSGEGRPTRSRHKGKSKDSDNDNHGN